MTERFAIVESHNIGRYGRIIILVDMATGVNYLSGEDRSLTPLLDKSGNVVISNTEELEKKYGCNNCMVKFEEELRKEELCRRCYFNSGR